MQHLRFLWVLTIALACASTGTAQDTVRRVEIRVDERGYHPGTVRVQPGETITLVFTRTTSAGCGGTVVIPSRNIRRQLPVNEPVEITVTVRERESLSFTCGMGMYRGSVVVD